MKYILVGHELVPCDDVETWGRWMETADRRVALSEVTSTVKVSTVFIGLDHGWGAGRPILFETMVFRNGHGFGGDEMRYATWAEAETGHWQTVARVTEAESMRSQR